jgi:hypothetical protein
MNSIIQRKEISKKIIKSVIIVFILSIFIYIIFLKTVSETNKLEKNHRFTIGLVTEIVNPTDGEKMLNFDYYANEKYFKGSFSVNGISKIKYKVGQRFYVKYYPLDPTISVFLPNYLVPDTIINSPSTGWEIMPSHININKLPD